MKGEFPSLPQLTFVVTNNGLGIAGATAGDAKVASQRRPSPSPPWGIQPPEAELTFYLKWSTSVRKLVQGGVVGEGGMVLLSQKFTGL